MSDSHSFYDAFAKRMNIDSNEKQHRPRIGVTGEAFEFTTGGIRRERTNVTDDPYRSMPNSQNEARSQIRMGTGKTSLQYQSGIASSVNYDHSSN